jgi:lysozyme
VTLNYGKGQEDFMLKGIDVSEYQGNINWTAVAESGVRYCFVKASEGVESRDPLFAKNWAGMKSVGIIRSAYHFFIASKDPVIQAQNFLGLTRSTWEASDLPPVLDLEKSYGMSADRAIDQAGIWLDTVEKAIGRRPILYTFPSFWHDALGNSPRLGANYKLWIAHYETHNPWVPGGWKSWTFHQYSESGKTPGIAGPCDLNHFNGDLDTLQTLLKAKAPLRQGCEGKIVAEMQTLLNAKGANIGVADGKFGPKTKQAVVKFQNSVQLLGDGIVGMRTWSALQATGPAKSPVASTLVNVCKSYKSLPHQDTALTWIENNLPKTVFQNFVVQWRQVAPTSSMASTPLSFINVCKSYKDLPHQIKALQDLQRQTPQATLDQFMKLWRQA